MKDILTVSELADYTGFKVAYIYQLTHRKEIPHYKPTDRKLFFLWAEIKEWLLKNRITPVSEIEAEATSFNLRNKRAV
jgi:excisionase family DNA binding protein